MALPILLSIGLMLISPSISFAQTDCDHPTLDTDGDGIPDCKDWCPLDPNKTEPNLCGCGVTEDTGDADNDGVLNCEDVCPNNPEKSEEGDEGACGCDATLAEDNMDSDGDGTPDCLDGSCNNCDAPGIVSVAMAGRTACDGQGSTNKGDDTFTADLVVTFNFAPTLGAIRVRGDIDARYDFRNRNTSSSINIGKQTFRAFGCGIHW